VRKGEGLVAEFLKSELYEYSKEWNPSFLGSKRMDYQIPKINTCFEIDGLQHFTQVWNWKSPEEQRCNDIDKMKKCVDNGISIIRIYQPSITKMDHNWKIYLSNSIRYIIESTEPIIIFPKNIPQYDIYRKECDCASIIYISL
jgi:very-short-patch-repair endonuclease